MLVTDPMFQESDQPSVVDRVEETPDVGVQDEVHFTSGDLQPPAHPARRAGYALAENRS